MGLGVLGAAAAKSLQEIGFQVMGWSRHEKNLPGVTSFAGPERLDEFLAASEILICLLPLTPATDGIIDGRLLAALPDGACLINGARGGLVVEADLIAALQSGRPQEALAICGQVLAAAPDNPEALNLAGVAAFQTGDGAEAADAGGAIDWSKAGKGGSLDRKITRLNSTPVATSFAVFCLNKTLHSSSFI